MKFLKPFLLSPALLWSGLAFAQIGFVEKSNQLTPQEHFSGVAVAVLDMNGDGFDDIVRMNQGNELNIQFQNADGTFLAKNVAPVSTESQWGICAGDLDNNGYGDVLTGGSYDGIKIIRANEAGTAYLMETKSQPGTFVQGVNFADINNDGWLDAFVCHDDGVARIFINDGTGELVYNPNFMDLTTTPASDNSGNYGSEWCDIDNDGDLDLYIAKCRQGVDDPTDGRRINQLFLNNGDGTYSQDLTNLSGLRIGAQSWTADFGDIDNDGDFDVFITNHDVSSQILVNDGAGHFTDITASTGITPIISDIPIQGIFRDFDNDGFQDILVAGGGTYLIHNNGDGTFTEIVGAFDNNVMESYAVGDLNHDGFIDIYGSYAQIYTTPSSTTDKLWINTGNDNHYFGMILRGVQSNRDAIGARVTVYTALGIQIREVRSGDSYGIMNSLQMQFGLGQVTLIDSVVVRWPSGTIDRLYTPAVDQYLTLQEGGCFPPATPGVEATNGANIICSGETTTLGTTKPYNQYLWSTGDTTSTITVGTAGLYKVTVSDVPGCTSVSTLLEIIVDPIQIPAITAESDTIFCAGQSVTLSSSAASAYTWSTGETTQSIVVNAPGNYFVTAQGQCDEFVSAPIKVVVLDPGTPVIQGDTVGINTVATLSANGTNVQWYGNLDDVIALQTGNTYVTDPLLVSDTLWVSTSQVFDQPNDFAGMPDHMGTSLSGNQFNGKMFFDVYKAVQLKSVKVYTNKAGIRTIELRNSTNELLESLSVNIPTGTTVLDLNFDLPVGSGFYMTTNSLDNQTNLATNSPQLRRSDQGVQYPYTLENVLSITGNDLATDRYYYFFNWEIDYYQYECESPKVPVIAYVDPNIVKANEPVWASGLQLYPNPSTGAIQVSVQVPRVTNMEVRIKNAQGALMQSRTLEMAAGKNNWTEQLGQLPAGIYWLEFASQQEIVRRKLILE